jgi:putative oxidoreductase
MARPLNARFASCGITVLRIVVGIVFILHGYQKLFVYHPSGVASSFSKMGLPAPTVSAWAASLGEFGGGLLLALGLFTRVGAILIAAVMAVAFATVHGSKGFFLPGGYEYVLVLFAAAIALLFTGGGCFSVDGMIGGCGKSSDQK